MDRKLKKLREAWNTLEEYIEPSYPAKVKSSIKNKAGVQGSIIPLKQYQFTTSKGNDVKVHFKIEDYMDLVKTGNVVFYVNDTLDDSSSSQEGSVGTDPEILSGVLGIVKKIADKLKLDEITFEAWKGKGDEKVVKDLNYQEIKPKVEKEFNSFYNKIVSFEPELLPISDKQIELGNKLGREPKPIPEINKENIIKILNAIKKAIDNNILLHSYPVDELNHFVKNNERLRELFPESKELVSLLYEYSKRMVSNSERGFVVKRNRRASLYKKFVSRFMPEWDINVDMDHFTLTRK
jgi:hypothetical protein